MPPISRPKGPLTHKELLEHVHYDPETGIMVWIKPGPRRRVGAQVGTTRETSGYIECVVCGEFWRMNRLIWFYMTGEYAPVDRLVDHKDKDRSNNRWKNLRLATDGQNQINSDRWGEDRGIQKRIGKRRTRYRVRIRERENTRNLGTFDTIEEARAVFHAAAKEQYGEFYDPT
jgi:hypothetical protein